MPNKSPGSCFQENYWEVFLMLVVCCFFFRLFHTLLFNIILYQVYPYRHLPILHFQVNSMQSDLQHFHCLLWSLLCCVFHFASWFCQAFLLQELWFSDGFFTQKHFCFILPIHTQMKAGIPHSGSSISASIELSLLACT